jgi:hypothetical protein
MGWMVDREIAREKFNELRAKRDEHAARGERVKAAQAHEAASQVVKDYRAGKR